LSGAASAAPRRFVGREAGVQVNAQSVGRTHERALTSIGANPCVET
jgi:hypothetical protein